MQFRARMLKFDTIASIFKNNFMYGEPNLCKPLFLSLYNLQILFCELLEQILVKFYENIYIFQKYCSKRIRPH